MTASTRNDNGTLIPIPDKRYHTIGETARICGLKPHVLRYWEQVFPQLKPIRRKNRRYYQSRDIQLIRQICTMLHEDGLKINGAKQVLANRITSHKKYKDPFIIKNLINDLENIFKILKDDDP